MLSSETGMYFILKVKAALMKEKVQAGNPQQIWAGLFLNLSLDGRIKHNNTPSGGHLVLRAKEKRRMEMMHLLSSGQLLTSSYLGPVQL